MDLEQELYNSLGRILVNISPEDTKTVIMYAKLWPEGDASEYTFNYVKLNEQEGWLDPADATIDELEDRLKKLQRYDLDNNLTNGYPVWTSCLVTVNIASTQINIKFDYPPLSKA